MNKSKTLIAVATATLLLSGCAKDGLSVSTIGKPEVAKRFETGTVISTAKVLVDKTLTATLTGAAAGGVIGAVAKHSVKDASIGAVAGALVGAIGSKISGADEIEAYETKIKTKNGIRIAYLEKDLPAGTVVEFVDRGEKITNVDVKKIAPKPKPKTKIVYRTKTKTVVKEKIVYRDRPVVKKPKVKKPVKPVVAKAKPEPVETAAAPANDADEIW